MTFQRLFDQLMEYAIEFETLRKNLMSMAYRFLFDNAKQITREQSLNSKVPVQQYQSPNPSPVKNVMSQGIRAETPIEYFTQLYTAQNSQRMRRRRSLNSFEKVDSITAELKDEVFVAELMATLNPEPWERVLRKRLKT